MPNHVPVRQALPGLAQPPMRLSELTVLNCLAELTLRLGTARLGEGNEAAARDLFRDAARKYAHLSAMVVDAVGKSRYVDLALSSAVRSGDHGLSFDIAMGSTSMINGGEYVPVISLADSLSEAARSVDGVRSVVERNVSFDNNTYMYKIHATEEDVEKLVMLAEGTAMKYAFNMMNAMHIEIGETSPGRGIKMHYGADGMISIFSSHLKGDSEQRKTLVNSIAAGIELLLRS